MRPVVHSKLAYASAGDLIFGSALHPVTCGFGVQIGAGAVHPEVNYTLAPTPITPDHYESIRAEYRDMVEHILHRAAKLGVEAVVLEFEHLPELTLHPLGAEITAQTKELMATYHEKEGLRSALRATICDVRDATRPPKMRTGPQANTVLEAFEANARAGADLLSIESTGGKEVTDKALVEADIPGLLFGLGVLAPRDQAFLWEEICRIAADTGSIAAGDTACGFGNTAMVLADQGFIPVVLAAVVRAMTAVRTLVPHECGAVGPTKDCGYEGVVIKAITGVPISMEGKSAACAHFSHVGNIAAAAADLWSNESVQNVRLLAGPAPECFTELLAYDCRLFNGAIRSGKAADLRDLMVASDEALSAHAFIISPEASYEIARAIVAEDSWFARTRAAALRAISLMRTAVAEGRLAIAEREGRWLGICEDAIGEMDSEQKVLAEVAPAYAGVVDLAEYGL